MCFLSNNIYDYVNVSQGKITVPGMDDGEECQAMDVSLNCPKSLLLLVTSPFISPERCLMYPENKPVLLIAKGDQPKFEAHLPTPFCCTIFRT